jgi:hypothetical protein
VLYDVLAVDVGLALDVGLELAELVGGFVEPGCDPSATWPVVSAPAELEFTLAVGPVDAVPTVVFLFACPVRSQFQLEHPAAIVNTAIAPIPLKVCSDFMWSPFVGALGVLDCSRSTESREVTSPRSWGRRTTICNDARACHEWDSIFE